MSAANSLMALIHIEIKVVGAEIDLSPQYPAALKLKQWWKVYSDSLLEYNWHM